MNIDLKTGCIEKTNKQKLILKKGELAILTEDYLLKGRYGLVLYQERKKALEEEIEELERLRDERPNR